MAPPSRRRVACLVEWNGDGRGVVVNDTGDDPDCSDGTRKTAEVRVGDLGRACPSRRRGDQALTRSGLGPAAGEPAINPVPGRVITTAAAEVRTVL